MADKDDMANKVIKVERGSSADMANETDEMANVADDLDSLGEPYKHPLTAPAFIQHKIVQFVFSKHLKGHIFETDDVEDKIKSGFAGRKNLKNFRYFII